MGDIDVTHTLYRLLITTSFTKIHLTKAESARQTWLYGRGYDEQRVGS